jgi:ATP/maltotriose-dependent transcriptional regulator MalT
MAAWGVQLVIGKLITDAGFLERFEARLRDVLVQLREQGIDLRDEEVAAFRDTDPRLWTALAAQIDPRLQTARSAKRTQPLIRNGARPLTARERCVLRGIVQGRTNKQIALEISVSVGAVKATVQQLFQKLRVRKRTQLVRAIMEGSLVTPRNSQDRASSTHAEPARGGRSSVG